VTLTCQLEFELQINLEPTLVLLDALTTRELVGVLWKRVGLGAARGDFEFSKTDELRDSCSSDFGCGDFGEDTTYEDARSEVLTQGQRSGNVFRISETTHTTIRCVLVAALFAALALSSNSRLQSSGSTPSFSVAVERAPHWRFFEWRTRVAPTQIAVALLLELLRLVLGSILGDGVLVKKRINFTCVVVNVFATHGLVGLAISGAHVFAHVLLELLLEKFLCSRFSRKGPDKHRKAQTLVAWFLLLLELGALNALETTSTFGPGTEKVSLAKRSLRCVVFPNHHTPPLRLPIRN